jgi:hypothetical protein
MTVPETSPDRRPGSKSSLETLHALVPAAEEVDLAERLTVGQATGLLEHVLGAEVIEVRPNRRTS